MTSVAAGSPEGRGPAVSRMTALLYAVFLLSGAAGLIYESIWTRYLGLFVGHSAYAQVIVLVIFLGGMSLGAYLIGRLTLRIERPLFWYAVVELATGIIGLGFHLLFVGVTSLTYDRIFPALGHGSTQLVVKWGLAAALILPQSILLGMTFPLMSAGVTRRERSRPGHVLSMLYFSNSMGAAIGVLVAGFLLVNWWGLPGTLATAAILNLIVALAVLLLVRTEQPRMSFDDLFGGRAAGQATWKPDRRWALLIGVSFFTAVSSFFYEIGWIRMLSLVLGSATHSFELMLSAFILGLAIGAWWIGRQADIGSSMPKLARVQLAMGALAIATLPVYLKSFDLMAMFIAAFAKTPEGYFAFSITRYLICLAVMLPATICAGMTLPLITRSLTYGSAGERAIGQVYAVNTLGSIVGAALAGLALLPLVGLKWLIVIGAGIDIAVGVVLYVENLTPARVFTPLRGGIALAGAALIVLVVVRSNFDQSLLSSGVYRHGIVRATGGWPVTYYRDGRTATVSMRRVPSTGIVSLITNGKVDASLGPEWLTPRPTPGPLSLDAPTQLFISLFPLAHAPHAKTAAIIGQGSGMTTHVLLGSPELERVVTVEIEPLMIDASRNFYPANRRAFEDPRSEFVIDDARAFFASEHGNFDLIVAEPSNPWVSGVSGLFTTEFYHRVKQRLSPDGVFAQWLQVYEIDDDLVLSVLDAIDENFESWEIFYTAGRNVLIVASPNKLAPPDWSVMNYPGVAEDLRITWPVTEATLERMRIAGKTAMEPLLKRLNVANSDFHPRLDVNSERARYMDASARGLRDLPDGVNMPAMMSGRRQGGGVPYAIVPSISRLSAMAINASMRTGDPRGGALARTAAERVRAFEANMAHDSDPAEWRLWVRQFAEASQLVDGGMSGVVDTGFFGRVNDYVRKHRAPPEVRATVAFMHGVAAWDYREAAQAGDALIRAAVKGDVWIDPDYLRDGAVMAFLEQGDRAAARDAYAALQRWSARPPDDLRNQLLRSYILEGLQADAAQSGDTVGRGKSGSPLATRQPVGSTATRLEKR